MTLKTALENPELAKSRREDERRKLWERIKTESPNHAEFIKNVSRIFGKPKEVCYERH